MRRDEMLQINKAGWDEVATQFSGITALPVYGPFMETEDVLKVFDDVRGRRVLEIGCGDGHSLVYMASHGAEELWGLDLSPVQIASASRNLEARGICAKLFTAPMEADIGLPREYFDIVFSIYGLGWTTDLPGTLDLVVQYLKPGGCFIFSWEHPFYSCLACEGALSS